MSTSVGQLDLNALGQYLAEHIEGFGTLKSAKKFSGGQSNPTFLLESDGGQFVLRRQPPGKLLKSAHAVDREYRILNALSQTKVPVPKTYLLCEDTKIVGSMFYVMEFVEGDIFWDPLLEDKTNEQRARIYDQHNEVLAAIHNVDIDAVGLSDYGRPGNYFSRQVDLWTKQYRASETEQIPEMDTVIDWVAKNVPEDDGRVSISHGDYRLDNLIFNPESLEVITVLDWELSTLGHPFADLAYQCTFWRMPRNSPIPGLLGIDREELGIPSEEEYVAKYCERTGIEKIDNWAFYIVFCLLRAAGIAQGVMKRAQEGNASSKQALAVGAMVKVLAKMAVDVIENEA